MARFSPVLLLLFLVSPDLAAYKLIAPTPFSVINKNYIKLQVLAEAGDQPSDSVMFDIFYNAGKKLTISSDASLSYVQRLNDFNDGIFYVRARVYYNNTADTLSGVYDHSGIPVILDRHRAFNEETFTSFYLDHSEDLVKYLVEVSQYKMEGNNNNLTFSSCWNYDSIYFHVEVKDANVNYVNPQRWDFFQAKQYLNVLWNSDCIEIGLDLMHNRNEWKQADDYELLIDGRGNYVGNQWSITDSLYNNWGKNTRVKFTYTGTVNNNQDTDEGYHILVAIPWTEFGLKPVEGQSIGFDIQLYDKDADLDESFRSSLSGTNPESNDNTSEWTTLTLAPPQPFLVRNAKILVIVTILLVLPIAFLVRRRLTRKFISPAEIAAPEIKKGSYSQSTNTAIDYVTEHYHEPELSRQQIAEKAFITEKYLSSLFKKETGVNLVTYINKYRIDKSIDLLKTTRLTIAEIAFKIGYNSLQNFNKNFKSITGKTPSDFRK